MTRSLIAWHVITNGGRSLDPALVDDRAIIHAAPTGGRPGARHELRPPEFTWESPIAWSTQIPHVVIARLSRHPQKRQAEFTLTPRDLAYWDPEAGDRVVEPGRFTLQVDSSSADVRCRGAFALTPPA